MRNSKLQIAIMLTGLALFAFQPNINSQSRTTSRSSSSVSRSSSPSSSRSSSSVSRSSSSSSSRSSSSVSRSSSPSSSRSSSSVSRSTSSSTRRSTTVTRTTPTSTTRQTTSVTRTTPSTARSSATVTRTSPASSRGSSTSMRSNTPSVAARPDVRPNPVPKPMTPHEVQKPHQHPRDRGFIDYNRRPPHKFYSCHHHHYFGYRVRVLPVGYAYRDWYGVRYYFFDDVYYRYCNGYYIVCRPPFGTILASNLIADMAWAAVRMNYYNTVYQTYSTISENNSYIVEQNKIIAENNALITKQNEILLQQQELMSQKSDEAYKLATAMGLLQSYAAADSEYFYQDGIFYTKNDKGEYWTIVAPAGAIVETLPEDYDIINFEGKDYYKVDDTVYRVVISDGKPYFEVLGQMANA